MQSVGRIRRKVRKNSVRVYVFRFALKLRHCSTQPAVCTENLNPEVVVMKAAQDGT